MNDAIRTTAEDERSTAAEKSPASDADIKGVLSQSASIASEHERAVLAMQGK